MHNRKCHLLQAGAALLLGLVLLSPIPCRAAGQEAVSLPITVTADGQNASGKILDGAYSTTASFPAGTTLTVSAKEEGNRIYGLYIVWAKNPGPWTLSYGESQAPAGTHGFLHEYVPIEGGAEQVSITLSQEESICCLTAYSSGALPNDIQVWEPECDRADILLFSTHADDEILFFGGVLPEYAGERGLKVQLVYFSNYFLAGGDRTREHEKLDGLWTAGVRQYPVNAPFPDYYSGSLAAAKELFGWDEPLAYLTEQIRKFKPQVCIAQDTNGEYGHGTHMLTSALMQEAVKTSMDPSFCPDSAETYGVWDVPKTYIHLYGENKISLDCRKPLEAFGGQTALEVATAAYKKHVTQQWCWFYVSDTYEYSIAEYGMCRSTVGADTGNDMMEHLVSYAEQDRLEAERKAEEERKAKEEAERKAREEAERKAKEEAERKAQEEAQRKAAEEAAAHRRMLLLLLAAVLLTLGLLTAFLTRRSIRRKIR